MCRQFPPGSVAGAAYSVMTGEGKLRPARGGGWILFFCTG